MRFQKTASPNASRAQRQQMAASAPGDTADLAQLPGGARGRKSGSSAPAGQAGADDEPFVIGSANVKNDPFSCLPPIYDPNASFVVDSAQSEISELLSPESEDAAPSSEPDGP